MRPNRPNRLDPLRLLRSVQHGAVKVPSSEEVKDTLYELLKGDERPDLDDIDEIQRVGRYHSLAILWSPSPMWGEVYHHVDATYGMCS